MLRRQYLKEGGFVTQTAIDTRCYVPQSDLRLSGGLLRREGNEVCCTKLLKIAQGITGYTVSTS